MSSSNSQRSIDKSALATIIGIVLLFSTAIIVTLISPRHLDPSWTEPSSSYQQQMFEVADPNFFISVSSDQEKQFVHRLQAGYTLLAFVESPQLRIQAPKELQQYVTREGEPLLLTSRLLLLRHSQEKNSAGDQVEGSLAKVRVLELYDPEKEEAFSLAHSEGVLEDWVDRDFTILDPGVGVSFHRELGVIYVQNPEEYKIRKELGKRGMRWRYDSHGESIASLEELKGHTLGFVSRQQLIRHGEEIYANEGCWYCHSDQTRTLVQDTVLNGSDSYPAPPSSANEYIYQAVTFLSTRRIGPDLSRVGIKRPSRDWHRAHFWSPVTQSKGSLMPPFLHFFDNDPSGVGGRSVALPNYEFESIFQYLMTKGTRITPPTQAWWLGRDPINTLAIIEGRQKSETRALE